MQSFRRCRWPALIAALLMALHGGYVQADSKTRIDDGAVAALDRLREYSPEAGELLDKAAGVLVFPDVVKMGFGVGGQYGEGSLLIEGSPVAYYATAGASFGLLMGAQLKSEVVLFMTAESLAKFRGSHGWQAGVDSSVALFKLGAGGSIDTRKLAEPVIGFIFSNRGLIYNLTLEGSKITPISR